MLIVNNRQPRATIVLGRDATWIERHAADELKRYLRALSGADVPITARSPSKGTIVAIGRTETNPVVAGAVRRGLVRLSSEFPGHDGFIVEAAKLDGREVLILGGSQDRGALYAVYWFLEEVLGVGFFRDGERIPDMPTVEVTDLRIAERPHFADREDGNGCIFTYSCSGWTFDDWRHELDWKAKRRANIIWTFNVGQDILGTILADWGVPVERPLPPAKPTIHEQAFEYASKLGILMPCMVPSASVPDAFYKTFPECRTLLLQWSEFPPYRQLHPADPHFRELIAEFVRRYRRRYGIGHLYVAEFASESKVLEGAANIQEVRLDFARAMSEALKEADPEAVWVPSSWSFDLGWWLDDAQNPNRWTPEDVRQYLDAMTVPHVVWDLWSEERAKYLETDYFFGHPWGFGVLHSFGAGSYLHGDAPGLIRRVHELLNEPKADTCNLFLVQSEIIHFNSFYYELCAKLAWNPSGITVGGYIEEYCRKRYGDVGKGLEPAFQLLVETVYGSESGSVGTIMDPLYWFRLDLYLLLGWTKPDEKTAALRARRPAIIPKLRRAAELFLSQPELLRTNDMARRDLVDIARHWIAERFNIAILRARDAFLAGDAETFEESARLCMALLDDQARLLASWPPYRLDRKVKEHKHLYGDDAARWVKHTHLWCFAEEGKESVPLRDYYRMDLDVLLADCYKPRVAAYFDLLRRKLAQGEKSVRDDEFDAVYRPIEESFIAAPVRPLPGGEDPVAVVRELVVGESR